MATGPKPKPTHLKLLQGNPGKRRLNENEPQPEPLGAKPEPPSHLSDEARAEWDRAYPILARNRMITEVDLTAFAAYCVAYGRWQHAERQLAKDGPVITVRGLDVPNPYVRICNVAMGQVHKFLAEFGMTPSSRSRVQVAGGGRPKSNNNRFLALAGSAPKGKV